MDRLKQNASEKIRYSSTDAFVRGRSKVTKSWRRVKLRQQQLAVMASHAEVGLAPDYKCRPPNVGFQTLYSKRQNSNFGLQTSNVYLLLQEHTIHTHIRKDYR